MLLQFIIYCSEDQNFIILHEYLLGSLNLMAPYTIDARILHHAVPPFRT